MLTTLIVGAAMAAPLHGGELSASVGDNAYTLPAGAARLQLSSAGYGITDHIELSIDPRMLLGGANMTVEANLLSTDSHALSLSATGFAAWLLPTAVNMGTLGVSYTFGGAYTDRFTVSSQVTHVNSLDVSDELRFSLYSASQLSSRVTYDWAISEEHLVQFSAEGTTTFDDGFLGFGVGYTRVWDQVRFQAGLASGGGPISAYLAEISLPEEVSSAYLPLPYMMLWVRL